MARTAKELMAEAKKLMETARKVEESEALKIGKFVLSKGTALTIAELRQFVGQVTGVAEKS